MKTKLFAVLTAGAALTLVLGSCNHPKTEDEAKVVVELAVTDITSTFAHVEATPSDLEATYYFDVVKKPGFDEIKSKGAQAFIDAEVERRMEAYSLSRTEVLEKLLSKGVDSHDFTTLEVLTDYYALAFGVNAEGQVTGELAYKAFTTLPVAPSANQLGITVTNIYDDGADYKVVPTVEADTYAVDIWSKPLVDELGDSETIKYFIEYNSFMMFNLTTSGTFEFVNEVDGKVWQPGREYYVVAFGYADGEPTTTLFKQEFKTVGGDPAACTFEFTVSDITANSAKVKIVPSDKKVVYLWNVLDMTRFNQFKETAGTDEATLEYILNGYIEEDMTNNAVKRQQAVEELGRWSGFTSSDEEGADQENFNDLPSGEEFIAWAVAVDANGKPEGKFFTTKFKTL